MMEPLKNRWTQLIIVAVLMALAGGVGAQLVFSQGAADQIVEVADRVMLTSPIPTGQGNLTGGGASFVGAAADVFAEELPLTAAAAIAAGWQDPVLCDAGRGRTFKKDSLQDAPYLLIYDRDDELLGMYWFSMNEVTGAPWSKMTDLVVAGRSVIEEEHWAMLVYFRDPTIRACSVAQGGCGFSKAKAKSGPDDC